MTTENEQRQRFGLRTIKSEWSLESVEGGDESWKTTSVDHFLAKKVHRDSNGKLSWEEDYYYSGKTFTTIKGQNWEMLTVHYDYSSNVITVSYVGQEPAIKLLTDRVNSLPTRAERFQHIEEILRRWAGQSQP